MRNANSKMPDLKRSEEYLRNHLGINEGKDTVTIACRCSRAISGGVWLRRFLAVLRRSVLQHAHAIADEKDDALEGIEQRVSNHSRPQAPAQQSHATKDQAENKD
jgi:hypothetical protein